MDKKIIKSVPTILLFVIIAINFYLLFMLQKNSISRLPLKELEIGKPTIIIIFDEFECVSCVNNLIFLNQLYSTLKSKKQIEMQGIILSKNRTDSKGISKAFNFPFVIMDDFKILKRLNMNQTPIILGLSVDHRIYFSDLVPFQAGITEDFVKKGVLDRLYYSLSQ